MENEALASGKKKIVIIGSGPNRVGQGIEFDYACVHAAFALKDLEIESIMINCNPETVSTDYDTSNRLFFEPLTDEHVMNVIENEIQNGDLLGVIVQFGGQTPLKLRKTLKAAGVKILGMTKDAIDICDDRASFSGLVKQVGAREAESFKYSNREELEKISRDLNFKFIIRPSAVIGGRGMAIIESESELLHYMESEKIIPIGILNPLLEKSIELDIDLLRDKNGSIFIFGFLEHIEFVGVHSGDSSCSVQARLISASAKANIEKIACNFANTLGVTGLINIQVAVKGEEIFIIEVNPRASRTVPFTAKSINFPAIKIAVKLMCGQLLEEQSEFKNYNLKQSKDGYYILKDLGYSCIKEPVFSFEKFLQSDIVRGPEMKSLGEVMGIGASFGEAFAKALIASGQKLDFIKQISGTAFISVKEPDKNEELIDICANLIKLDFTIVATKGTAQFLSLHGVPCTFVNKVHEGGEHIVDLINNNKINFVINTTSGFKSLQDSFLIRRSILRNKILHSTTIEGGKAIIEAITAKKNKNLTVFKL
jgi:carbamoyl-phosphate synthase large subunit